jgi:hypothetical protein
VAIVIGAMVVIMIIPIVIGVPAVSILVPPAVVVVPAVGTRFRKFMAPMLGLGTAPTVMLDGLVQLVIRLDGALLAIVGPHNRGTCEEKHSGKYNRAQYKA